MPARLFQIAWSPQTLAGLDPGFEVIDNLANPRPDWREYAPIRRFLLTQPLDEGTHYGFFSPRFGSKTGLSAATARRFVEGSDADVVGLSPFFDQMAFYRNIFVQAANQQPGLGPLLRQWCARLTPGVDMDALVMDSSDSIFCNYFAARPAFWREWLALGEQVWAAAENPADPRAAGLNAAVAYDTQRAPAKVFLIERLVCLLLVREPGRWTVRTLDPTALPYSAPETVPHAPRLLAMDALKRAWRASGHAAYLRAWEAMFDALAREAGRSVQP